MRRLTLALAIVLVPRLAAAADWYVDAAAPPGGDGSQAKPFATINAAIPSLMRGDTLWLASGTYGEIVNIGTLAGSSGQTTLRAMPGSTPIIDGTSGSSSAGYVIQTATPDTTFEGLTIQNSASLAIQFYYADGGQVIDCTTTGIMGNAVTFYYSNQGLVQGCKLQGNVAGRQTTGTVVTHNEVYGSSAEGVGLYDGSTGCTVAHNVIHDNFSVNLYLDSISHSVFDGNLIFETDPNNDLEGIEISDEGHYMDLPAPVNSYNTIINNVIVGHNLGIVFWYSGEWSTQALNDESGLRYDVISNNTLLNNKGSFKWDASPAHVGTTIQNNIVVAQTGTSPLYAVQAKSSNGVALDHNLWFVPDLTQPFLWLGNQVDHAGFVTASGEGGGDVLTDPLFAAAWAMPMATDLELTIGSPAIGAGVTLTAVTDDFLGAPRPGGGKYDLGAFQYGATVPDGGVVPLDAAAPGDAATSDVSAPDSGMGMGVQPDAGPLATDGGAGHAAGPTHSGCGCGLAGTPGGREGALASLVLVGLATLRKRTAAPRGEIHRKTRRREGRTEQG